MPKTTVRSEQVRDDSLLIDDLRDFAAILGTGLNITVQAGRIRNDNNITQQSNQTVLLTASSTNYVELNSTGVASSNTSGFTSGKLPVAVIVTNVSAVTSISDKRTWVAYDNNTGSAPSFSRHFLTMGA